MTVKEEFSKEFESHTLVLSVPGPMMIWSIGLID
jgi:hypothetical protein